MNAMLKLSAIAVTIIAAIGNSSAMADPAPAKGQLYCIEDGAAIPITNAKDCRGKVRRQGKVARELYHNPACDGKPAGTRILKDARTVTVCQGNKS